MFISIKIIFCLLLSAILFSKSKYCLQKFVQAINSSSESLSDESDEISFSDFRKHQNPESFKSSYWNYLFHKKANLFDTEESDMKKLSVKNSCLAFDQNDNKFLSEKELCELLSIDKDMYRAFYEIIDRLRIVDRFTDYTYIKTKGLKIGRKFTAPSGYNNPKVSFFYITFDNQTYELERRNCTKENSKYRSLFLPEFSLINHKHITNSCAMFFDKNDFNKQYVFKKYENSYVYKFPGTFEFNSISNEVYNTLKAALGIAKAVKYLNKVHGRVHGKISRDNIVKIIFDTEDLCALKNNSWSFKIGENERLCMKSKSTLESMYMSLKSPEQLGFNGEKMFFCRKSEVWSVGVFILSILQIHFKLVPELSQTDEKHKGSGIYIQHLHDDSNNMREPKFRVKLENIKKCYGCTECNKAHRVKNLLLKLLVVDIDKRPNITECIDLIQERIFEEETWLDNQFNKLNLQYTGRILSDEAHRNLFEKEKIELNEIIAIFEKEKSLTKKTMDAYKIELESYEYLKKEMLKNVQILDAHYKNELCSKGK